MHKNMAFTNSSYAQVAGIQSEVNKVTVTRVAGSEVEYHRQMNLYRKDMEIVVRNLRKEQKKLRKAIFMYSRKLHESHRERARRDVEDRMRDKKSFENRQKVSEIMKMQDTQILSIVRENNDVSLESEEHKAAEARDEEEKDETDEETDDKHAEDLPEQVEDRGGVILPPISAPLTSTNVDSSDWDCDHVTREERTLPEIKVTSEWENKLSKHFRTLKPKKQTVSYADIIKLQHSTNPEKLFSLVNKLALKHGVKDRGLEHGKANLPRNTQERSVQSKIGSGLHAVNYGYTIASRQDNSIPSLKVDRHLLNESPLEDAQGRHDIYSTEKSPEIYSHVVKSPKSIILPSIHKVPPEESFSSHKRPQKRGPISWTQAIALIKSVHSL
ncbi:kinesin-like protein KIF21A isoform X2 [Saccostrea cucullata]|uniref:kinesin-like protein KIF21A isoform X2 n=1 Tax=Saccostrea cuccullata TaxID=36930 RepID=UPI002ED542A8